MNKLLILGLGFLALLIGLNIYRKRKLEKEYANMYSKFLKSDKYKIKGQFD